MSKIGHEVAQRSIGLEPGMRDDHHVDRRARFEQRREPPGRGEDVAKVLQPLGARCVGLGNADERSLRNIGTEQPAFREDHGHRRPVDRAAEVGDLGAGIGSVVSGNEHVAKSAVEKVENRIGQVLLRRFHCFARVSTRAGFAIAPFWRSGSTPPSDATSFTVQASSAVGGRIAGLGDRSGWRHRAP